MTNIRPHLRGFYGLVLVVALAGQALAAREWLGWPLLAAVAAVAGVEFGGVVLSLHADERRRLGERALPARLLATAVAAGAVAVNWFGHDDRMQGGFFAGMSALGFSIWLIDSAAKRRDALRAAGKLPPTPPVYGAVQWLRHPWLTRRARLLALIDPSLGLYGSIDAARLAVRTERRQSAIAAALGAKIRAAASPTMATIAVHTFDLDEVARRLAAGADYDGLTALLAVDLTPAALTAKVSNAGQVSQPGHVQLSHRGTVELSESGQSDRGEDSPRQLTQLAGAEISAPDQELISSLMGEEINSGDLFELAASLAEQRHYPLPREAAEQAHGTDGHGDSLSLAALMPAPTVAQTTTVARSLGDLTNGAHLTAAPPFPLPATEAPETAPSDGHSSRQNDRHDGTEMTVTEAPETPPADASDDGPTDGHDDGAEPATKPRTKPSRRRPTGTRTSATRVHRAAAKLPDASVAQIAKKAGVSESTARRHLAALNGHNTASGEG